MRTFWFLANFGAIGKSGISSARRKRAESEYDPFGAAHSSPRTSQKENATVMLGKT
jgi:deoxyxylulose-5-phosphate synthase